MLSINPAQMQNKRGFDCEASYEWAAAAKRPRAAPTFSQPPPPLQPILQSQLFFPPPPAKFTMDEMQMEAPQQLLPPTAAAWPPTHAAGPTCPPNFAHRFCRPGYCQNEVIPMRKAALCHAYRVSAGDPDAMQM